MESLLRGLFESHVDFRNSRVKPAGFNFKGDNFSVSKLAERSVRDAIFHFRENVAPYDYYANFHQVDLSKIVHQPKYIDSPSDRNPYHGTIYTTLPNDEIIAKQILLVIKQELAEISQLVKY